ncbi:MAG: hypothetical protein GY822_06575 [Deltaproteobacteria bacterium]|nr:hypothetical protein [Deltaproteobacteria bacterium]
MDRAQSFDAQFLDQAIAVLVTSISVLENFAEAGLFCAAIGVLFTSVVLEEASSGREKCMNAPQGDEWTKGRTNEGANERTKWAIEREI